MIFHLVRQNILSLILLFAWVSCSSHRSNTEADPNIRNSFHIVDTKSALIPPTAVVDKKQVSLSKDALDKEFLLQTSVISQIPNASSSGLKSRIVAFKRADDDIFLMEASQGHVITKDLPAQLILARFNILNETETQVTIDFNSGMASIFVTGDWSSEAEGSDYVNSFAGIDIKSSFIEELSFHGNALSIRQIAQISGSELDTFEVKYYLQPYQANTNFIPTPGSKAQKIGFFEIAPQYESDLGTGKTKVYASKFDLQKPLIFAISANTPAIYVEAVREGVLYWNRALPGSPIQVVMAPQNLVAPNFDYNIVQWVPWDNAGYAYADAQMDPRTGEILHAQVFLTSTFAVSGESAAESLIKSFDPNMFGMKKAFSMHGMVQKPMCAFHIPQHYIRALEGMLAREAPDSEYLRISRDYIRETVAHEIGHTLGLRHNFAGSLGASYSLDQREAIVHAYVTQQILPDNLQPSSSVMDYQVFEEAAMTGQIIAKTQRMLDYDKAAMEALYSGKKFAIDEVPAFCTDSQTDNLDCQTFDLGKTPVEFSAWTIKQYQKNLSKDLFAVILQAKKLGVAPKFEASAWASYLAADRYQILGLLANKTSLIQVRRKFTSRDDVASQQITQEESSLLQAALAKIGGWQGLLALPSQADWALVSAAVKQNMSSYSAIDKDGQSSGFSFDEQKKYGDLIDGFLQRLDLELAVDQWTNLSQIAPIGENIFADEFIAWLRDESSRLILSTEGTVKAERHLDDGTRVELILPVFKTVGALRGLVVSSLAGLAGKAQWKLSAVEENIYDHLSELLEASIPEQSTIKYRDLDVVAQEWRANQQALMTSLRD